MSDNKNANHIPAPGSYSGAITSSIKTSGVGGFGKAHRRVDFTTLSEKYKLYDGMKLD